MKDIIFRGTLTRDKLSELASQHPIPSEYDPTTNPDAISLIKQADGNWKGWIQKNGTVVEVREIKPEDCLIKLLTHS